MRVGIAHVCMGFGGSEAKVMWAIEALKNDHQVTLLTAGNVDLDALNAFYGTAVETGELSVRRMPGLLRLAARGDALRGGLFQRFCRSIAPEFDVVVSAYNPLDLGVRAMHFVADFSWCRQLREELDPIPRHAQRLIHRDGWLREAYLALGRRLGRPSGRDLLAGEDLLVANSEFTAGLLVERLGVQNVPIIYPPVAGEPRQVAYEQREQGFVCLGRVSHEKRIERMIGILHQVRGLGHDIHFHIVGPMPDTPYGRFIRRLCHDNRAWVHPEGGKTGAAKWQILAQHRYAIHGRPGEAFGIAVAEMAKAGCVPFVPTFGGPAEIVASEHLSYSDAEDAVQKIDHVLRSEALQRELSERLSERGRRFSPIRFMADVRRLVENFRSART